MKWIWGSTWSPSQYADYSSVKYGLMSTISGFFSGWAGIPFEVARKAYYADQSWPAELRKGYRSPLHALFKIPLTEGPLYLFKGGLPIYLGNSMFTSTTFYFYAWMKNKLFMLWLYNDINYNWVKFIIISISVTAGSLVGYPFYTLKEIMDTWPKERGGRCTFEGSYYNGIKWLRLYWETYHTNLMENFTFWFRTRGIIFFFAMWHADNMGLFTNNMSDPNTIDNILAEDESD